MSMIRATLVGGVLFLVPLGVLLLVLSEVMDLALIFAQPIADWFAVDDFLGMAAAHGIALTGLVTICFLAGLAAKSAMLSKQMDRLDNAFQGVVPGYMLIKSLIAGEVAQSEKKGISQPVVRVAIEGGIRFGFEMERNDHSGEVIVYLPGTPDPGTGVVMLVPKEVVTKSNLPAVKMLKSLRFYGRDLASLDQ